MNSKKKNKRILLIEDTESLRDVLEKLLQKYGYHVISCKSAVEALEVIRNVTPDVIVSDYNLDTFSNGVDLGRGIRQSMKLDIPVIIISGIEENQSHANAYSFGFLRKPFEIQQLSRVIRSCC